MKTPTIVWEPHGKRSVLLRTSFDIISIMKQAISWCKENNFSYWQSSADTIRFTKENERIAFLMRWG